MPKPLLPPVQRLAELRDRGLTHQQIADWVSTHEHVTVASGSVASAFSRSGNVTRPRPRYPDHLPWKVSTAHGQQYPAKMLRLLGRRDHGQQLTDDARHRLESWLTKLRSEQLVVVYDPDVGFGYAPGVPGPIPIRHDRRPRGAARRPAALFPGRGQQRRVTRAELEMETGFEPV